MSLPKETAEVARCEPQLPLNQDNDHFVQQRSEARLFLVLFLLGGILYWQTLRLSFVWDEYTLILINAVQGNFDWRNLPSLFHQPYFGAAGDLDFIYVDYYRPLPVLLHALTYRLVGFRYPVYHLESLFLHLGSACLFYHLLLALFGDRQSRASPQPLLLTAVLLFFLHPANVETVALIANQTGLLCAFFSLLSLCLWASCLDRDSGQVPCYFLSLLSLLLAMLSKETGYVVPLLHGLIYGLHARKRRPLDGLLLAGYFLILVVPVYVRSEYLNTPPLLPGLLAQASASGFWSRHFVTVVGLFFHQLCNWAVPLHTHLFQYPFSITDLRAKEILVSCGLLLLFLWRLRGERRLAVFGLFWFLILYLPSSNLLPLGSLPGGDVKAGAHHLYPAHAGLCLLVAASLFKPAGRPLQDPLLPRCAHSRLRKILPPALALCAAGLLSIQTFRFASCFRSADRFYEGVLDQNPLNTGARQNYAWHKWYLEKDPNASERILLEGLSATPRAYPKERADLHSSLIRLYLDTGRSVEASTLLRCLTRSWLRYVVGNLYFWDIVRNHEQEITEISGAGSDPDSNSQPDGSQGDLSGRPDPSGADGHGQAAASFQDVASQVNAAQAGAYNRTGTPCDGCGGASTRP